jgi:hypothetical protein
MDLTRPRVLLVSKTCRRRRSSAANARSSGGSARTAAIRPIATRSSHAPCMTWATWRPIVRETWLSPTPNIAVPAAASTSTPTCRTWPPPAASTRTALSPWPCGWWSRTACRTGRPRGTCGATTASSFPLPRSRTGWRRGEKRAEARITRDYLDTALTDFSGYIAADELYDGPYCVLSIVDNRRFKRLLYEVLDHNPTEEDILRFFRRFHEALTGRGLKIRGVTTDGSPLYPKTVAEVFGPVEHQLCQFHVLAELTKAVLKAVTKVRRGLKGALPKFGRGRPSRANRRRAARKKRIEKKIADLFEHRYLLVQHHLTAAQEKTLRRITRGQSVLRSLREIMDEVYRLFDRRCRTDTALAKLARLRRRVARFKGLRQTLGKLFSPNLEKALTFLDDSLLPATSNAVERGNRRHRKMQKTVYRVRTAPHISRRIAADMLREAQAEGRLQTTHTLHLARAG